MDKVGTKTASALIKLNTNSSVKLGKVFDFISQRFKIPITDLIIHSPIPEKKDLTDPAAWKSYTHSDHREI